MKEPKTPKTLMKDKNIQTIGREDIAEEHSIQKRVVYQKVSLWLRDRTVTNGDKLVEARVLTTTKRTQSMVAKAFIKDIAYGKAHIRDKLKIGFKCRLCERSLKLNENLRLIELDEPAVEDSHFNIICGKCWGGKQRDYKD